MRTSALTSVVRRLNASSSDIEASALAVAAKPSCNLDMIFMSAKKFAHKMVHTLGKFSENKPLASKLQTVYHLFNHKKSHTHMWSFS